MHGWLFWQIRKVTVVTQEWMDQWVHLGCLDCVYLTDLLLFCCGVRIGDSANTLLLDRNLYPKFASPWASSPCRPQDIGWCLLTRLVVVSVLQPACLPWQWHVLYFIIVFFFSDFHVPSEYLTNIHIRDKVTLSCGKSALKSLFFNYIHG